MNRWPILLFVMLSVAVPAQSPAQPTVAGRWSEKQAADWYRQQPWLVGANYTPRAPSTSWRCGRPRPSIQTRSTRSSAGRRHRHEHDARLPARSALAAGRRGLHEAARRVPAHRREAQDQTDARAVRLRLGSVAATGQAARRRNPACTTLAGCRARARRRCRTRRSSPRLEAYVKGVVGAFANDPRMLAWDIWNEPDNLTNVQLRQAGAGEQGANWCWRSCRRFSPGRARRGRSSR